MFFERLLLNSRFSFHGDGLIAAQILGAPNVPLFYSTYAGRDSTLHAVALPGLFRFHHDASLWEEKYLQHSPDLLQKRGPLEHLGVPVHLMRLCSLRRMFVAI